MCMCFAVGDAHFLNASIHYKLILIYSNKTQCA